MKLLIVNDTLIPALKYGGTERVIWDLGKELSQLGHAVDYLVKKGSACSFASKVWEIEEGKSIVEQVPKGYDMVHFNFDVKSEEIDYPHVVTIHGNTNDLKEFNKNSIFVSANHASRHNSDSYVYNGLDFENYDAVDFSSQREYYHFLGNVVWKEKNSKGAMDIAKRANEKIWMLGGNRFSRKMGIKFYPQLNARFAGLVTNKQKAQYMNKSKGLIFPVKWNEPFGLSMIESLYYGCPVFGTTHGSLPEIVTKEVGFLSNNSEEIVEAIKSNGFDKKNCHEYARENFNSKKMALSYLQKYQEVMNGNTLNENHPKISAQSTQRFLPYI